MCGIAGFESQTSQDARKILKDMNDAMIHRGPDDEGMYFEGRRGMAMRRLSIIDLAGGHQPIWNEDETIGVVFNGEIYNFRELRESLQKEGHRFSTHTDTEVLVHLYEKSGVKMLDALNGMFAFAIYDKNKNLWFLARDRMGEKPLHYYYDKGKFVFASEMKSILASGLADTRISLEGLSLYLTYDYLPHPYTIYQNIWKLPPAHYLLLKEDKLTVERYWKPSFKRPDKKLDLQSAVELLREHLKRSIRMRMVSDVPLGAFLSGGLDSSLIAALAAREGGGRLKTFNISFQEESFNESHHAREVARYLGTEHEEREFNSKTMLGLLPEIIQKLDEPFSDGSLIATYFLCRTTREQVKVALSGDGSDELFCGYPTYQAHRIARWIPPFIGPAAFKIADLLPMSDENISWDFKLRRFASGLSYPLPERNQIWLGSFRPEEKNDLLTPYVLESLKSFDSFQVLREHDSLCDSRGDFDRITNIDLEFFLQDQLFRVDRLSMASSLEVRAPFLDHLLVEFICSMPPEWKLKGMTTKYLLKKAAEGFLPQSIINRPKKGFGMPIAKWIKKDLKDLFLSVLREDEIRKTGLFNWTYVQRLLAEHLEGRRDHRKLLWSLFVFESWRQAVRLEVKV